MAKKKSTLEATDKSKEIVRVTFRFHGPELGQIREVRDMLSLNTEVDAARYLMQRGLEAMTATLTSRRVQGQMTNKINPEEMIKQMVAMGFGPGNDPSEGQSSEKKAKVKK
jgi:hypothetical protein